MLLITVYISKLVLLIIILSKSSATINSITNQVLCQTGIREDNSNYIYCARQNLTDIPKLTATSSSSSSSSIIYDEFVLTENQIKHLTQNSFDKNFKVRKLYLDMNPIELIESNAFDNVKNYLEELYIERSNNPLTSHSIDTLEAQFSSIANDINYNDDKNLFVNSIFLKCINLRILSIKNYKIRKLNEFEFEKLNRLRRLEIINSNLEQINSNAFKGLEETLIEIDFKMNNLNYVPIEAFKSLKQLKSINLAQNKIFSLNINIFFQIESINFQAFDLAYNRIKSIDIKNVERVIASGNASVKYLNLKNNELKFNDFMSIIQNLANLNELNVDFNKLNEEDNSAGNSVDSIDDYTYEFDKSATNIDQIQHENLKQLSLTGNNLYENFFIKLLNRRVKLNNLENLNLARNKLTKIPDNFFLSLNLINLKQLILDHNYNLNINQFNNKTFNGLQDCLELLSLNQLNKLDFDYFINFLNISRLNSLKYLKLTGIKELKSSNEDYEINNYSRISRSLLTLDLQNSKLKQLPKFICSLRNLNELDISNNKIKTIESQCFNRLNKLKRLNLNNNPLVCDCKLAYLKLWLDNLYLNKKQQLTNSNSKNDVDIKSANNNINDDDLFELLFKWTCNEPVNLKNKLFINLDLKNELVCDQVKTIASTSTVSLTRSVITRRKEATLSTTTTKTSTSTKTTTFIIEPLIHYSEPIELFESIEKISSSSSVKPSSTSSNMLAVANNYQNFNTYIIIGIVFGITTIVLSILLLIYTLYVKKVDFLYYYYYDSDKIKSANTLNTNTIINTQSCDNVIKPQIYHNYNQIAVNQPYYYDYHQQQGEQQLDSNSSSKSSNHYLMSSFNDYEIKNHFFNIESVKPLGSNIEALVPNSMSTSILLSETVSSSSSTSPSSSTSSTSKIISYPPSNGTIINIPCDYYKYNLNFNYTNI